MFVIKIPEAYPNRSLIEEPFKDLSLAYSIEKSKDEIPSVLEGEKIYKGMKEIKGLIEELEGYYGADYNCSCAR